MKRWATKRKLLQPDIIKYQVTTPSLSVRSLFLFVFRCFLILRVKCNFFTNTVIISFAGITVKIKLKEK